MHVSPYLDSRERVPLPANPTVAQPAPPSSCACGRRRAERARWAGRCERAHLLRAVKVGELLTPARRLAGGRPSGASSTWPSAAAAGRRGGGSSAARRAQRSARLLRYASPAQGSLCSAVSRASSAPVAALAAALRPAGRPSRPPFAGDRRHGRLAGLGGKRTGAGRYSGTIRVPRSRGPAPRDRDGAGRVEFILHVPDRWRDVSFFAPSWRLMRRATTAPRVYVGTHFRICGPQIVRTEIDDRGARVCVRAPGGGRAALFC